MRSHRPVRPVKTIICALDLILSAPIGWSLRRSKYYWDEFSLTAQPELFIAYATDSRSARGTSPPLSITPWLHRSVRVASSAVHGSLQAAAGPAYWPICNKKEPPAHNRRDRGQPDNVLAAHHGNAHFLRPPIPRTAPENISGRLKVILRTGYSSNRC